MATPSLQQATKLFPFLELNFTFFFFVLNEDEYNINMLDKFFKIKNMVVKIVGLNMSFIELHLGLRIGQATSRGLRSGLS
jgi:hypothetical protein